MIRGRTVAAALLNLAASASASASAAASVPRRFPPAPEAALRPRGRGGPGVPAPSPGLSLFVRSFSSADAGRGGGGGRSRRDPPASATHRPRNAPAPTGSAATSAAAAAPASSSYSSSDLSGRPTLEQTLAAASFVQTRLDSVKSSLPSSSSSSAELHDLLSDLHSIASDLLDMGAYRPAEQLFRYSLDEFDSGNAAVRERLSACLRGVGMAREAAEELYRVINNVVTVGTTDDEEGGAAAEAASWLYVDLGNLIEEVAPLPGSGPDWDDAVDDGDDAPRVRLGDAEGQGGGEEELTALDCYRRAIRLDPTNGLARKKLADSLAILGFEGEALDEFRRAKDLMPDDVCCATHAHYGRGGRSRGRGPGELRRRPPLPMAPGPASATVDQMSHGAEELRIDAAHSVAKAFERDGVVVLPRFVGEDEVDVLMGCVEGALSSVGGGGGGGGGGGESADFTSETRSPDRRVHASLPLGGDDDTARGAVSGIVRRLHPLLRRILQSDAGADADAGGDEGEVSEGSDGGGVPMPLLGCGLMRVHPGAGRQELHKDVHHYDRHGPVEDMSARASPGQGGPRTVSVQVQLTDTDADHGGGRVGSLEVLPGSHRPDGPAGRPDVIRSALEEEEGGGGDESSSSSAGTAVIPVDVPRGTVTIYSSRLWHRGGPNDSSSSSDGDGEGGGGGVGRTFCFLTVTEPDSAAPPGLIHTMAMEDVGRWVVTARGLEERKDAR